MKLIPIPYSFVRERLRISWRDALWGYENQKIGWSFIVDLAIDRLREGSDNDLEIELAGITKMESFQVYDLLRDIASYSHEEDVTFSKRKWLYLLLAWLFVNKENIEDPLEEVENIYSDFGYPHDIENFVRYMPVTDNYDPKVHTKNENETRLFGYWKKYLEDSEIEMSGNIYDK